MSSLSNQQVGSGTPSKTGQNKDTDWLRGRRREQPKYLMKHEIHALFGVIKGVRDTAIFRMAFHHGLRSSELGLLQMRDYRPSAQAGYDRIFIERLKGSISGDTLIVHEAALAIRKWVKKRGMAPGAMFLSQKRTPISRQRLDELMKHYCKLAGIPREKSHFHAIKHSTGTLMLSDRRESIVDVQRHLGHADIRSTMIYAELTEQANEERARRLKNWK